MLKKSNLKARVRKVRAKLAAAYYGNPARDMKVIAVVGRDGRAVVARFIQEILKAIDPRAGLVEGIPTVGGLQKQLARDWRAGANHVVVGVAMDELRNDVFSGVPVHMVVMADALGEPDGVMNDYELVKAGLFGAGPERAVLNRDDRYYEFVEKYPTKKGSASYGKERTADMWIGRAKLYKKGAEATLTHDGSSFEVATYVTGEEAASYMGAAAMAGLLLGVSSDAVVDGIANYEPAG